MLCSKPSLNTKQKERRTTQFCLPNFLCNNTTTPLLFCLHFLILIFIITQPYNIEMKEKKWIKEPKKSGKEYNGKSQREKSNKTCHEIESKAFSSITNMIISFYIKHHVIYHIRIIHALFLIFAYLLHVHTKDMQSGVRCCNWMEAL